MWLSVKSGHGAAHLLHCSQCASHCITMAPWYHHAYLPMRFLAWEVSADHYTQPPGIVSLLMLTITYIQAVALHTHWVGSTSIQQVAVEDHRHRKQCCAGDENGKYFTYIGSWTHISCILDQCSNHYTHLSMRFLSMLWGQSKLLRYYKVAMNAHCHK